MRALVSAITGTRLLPATQVPRAVLEKLLGHRGPGPSMDDALVLCLDWHGRQAGPERAAGPWRSHRGTGIVQAR